MKPLNLDNKPCSPTSSNCIIWQGPDIACIDLCTGDTISDVVFKLATELCTILDQTNVNNYDLACLGITACKPKDFQALIQLLIDKICEIQGITPEDIKTNSGCPDCVVSVAPCFRVGNVTTMQLLDYVQMIGEKICALIDEIGNINAQITDIIIRLEELENAPPPVFTIPSFTLGCDIGALLNGSTQFINVVLEEFINDVWCPFYAATGTTGDLINAVDAICITDADLQLTTGTPFSTNPNWIQSGSYNTVADAINNLWIAVCDVYNYASEISNITVQDTNTVDFTFVGNVLSATVTDTGWHNLLGFSYMSGATTQRPQCRRIGNEIIFRGVIQVPIGDTGSGASGAAISVNQPDGYRAEAVGRTLNAALSGDPDACAINGAGPSGTIPSGSTNIDEGIAIYFNRGQRAIPTAVLPAGINFDRDSTNGNRQLIFRNINVGGENVFLSSVSSVFVNTTGIVGCTAPYNNENYNGDAINLSSMQRNIVSNIIAGERIPLFDPTSPSLNNGGTLPTPPPPVTPITYNADVIGSTAEWPFTQNCMSAFQLGGFSIRLDGLRAYIDPCAAPIPTPNPCGD